MMRVQELFPPSNKDQLPVSSVQCGASREYCIRAQKRRQELAVLRRRHTLLWLAVAPTIAAGCVAVYAFFAHLLAPGWLLLPILIVYGLLRKITENSRHYAHVDRIVSYCEAGLARLSGKWRGQGNDGQEFEKEQQGHIYASDLGLFGSGSIFELLCTAPTGVGRATLADWLLHGSTIDLVLARQEAVRELSALVDFQEQWASAGASLQESDSSALRDWTQATPAPFTPGLRLVALLLPLAVAFTVVFATLRTTTQIYFWAAPLTVLLLLESIVAALYWRKSRKSAAGATLAALELSLMGPWLELMETAMLQSPLLISLQSKLKKSPISASREIRRLARLVQLKDLRQSDPGLFLAPFLFGTNVAARIEDWRLKNYVEIRSWLDALGEFDALLCLARHHFENPTWSFPVFRSSNKPLLHAESVGHPLLEPEARVPCNVALDVSAQLMIVSGSNMSGKSTLLRSVGLNAVLAFAGAPVCASRFELSWMQVACSISIQDSLQENKSRFQAEVERLKDVIDAARKTGVLFLLDEMLGGTNSQDRLFGARAVIQELLSTGAIGLITTHDLALTEISNGFNSHVRNAHFEEHYEDGQMRFDYILRPGVLSRTNGRNVMAALGLLGDMERA